MNTPKIYNRFERASRINENKVYDRHDNVDRLSFIDNAQMVKRLVAEGRSLAQFRAQALRSGQYFNYKDALSDDSGIATPVYGVDPVIAKPIVVDAMMKFETASAGVAKNDVNDESAKPADAVNDSSSDSKV